MENLGAKYTALYVSDPFRSIQFPSHREVERFLAEGTGNKSVDGCDGVCRIKSSFLEGIFVVSCLHLSTVQSCFYCFLLVVVKSDYAPFFPCCCLLCLLIIYVLYVLFQAIVLLIILISGLCCMMGIDTPTRFEAPTD